MPETFYQLDRRITVRLHAEGMRDQQGAYVRGAATDYEVWAMRKTRAASISGETEGIEFDLGESWLVRWRPEIARQNIAFGASVIDPLGRRLNILQIIERGERLRYLELEVALPT